MVRVGVVFGGPSPEHDISILTGLQAARSLGTAGHEVSCLYWTKSGSWLRVPAEAEARDFLDPTPNGSAEVELRIPEGFVERRRMRSTPLELDAVLNCCHGGPGEDGTLTGVLALAGVRVSGPRPQACALAMDKLAAAALAAQCDIPTIPTVLLAADDDGDDVALPPTPWVVKPRFGGSSIGVEAGVEDLETARALAQQGVGRAGTLVQPMLRGWIDVNVAVRTHPSFELSEIERPLRDGDGDGIYGYGEKYLAGGAGMESAPRELPAQIPDALRGRIREYAARLVVEFALTGAPRIDFLWNGEDDIVFCEVNSIPGVWGSYLWHAAGVSRGQLFTDLVAEAIKGPVSEPQWLASSDGRALRAAGSIAAKLA